jgi:hypothetical protein
LTRRRRRIAVFNATPTTPQETPLRRFTIGGKVFFAALLLGALLTIYAATSFIDGIASFPLERASAAVAEDLVAFHRAGEMALRGEAADAYDPAIFGEGLGAHQQGLLWLNPPHAYFLTAPLALLPYGAAKALFIILGALSIFGMMAAAKLRAPAFLALALFSPAALIATMLLQLGAFIALGLAAALVLAPKRPIVAGIILAMLTMKPQYGLMAPIFLIATAQWRALACAAIATILLIAMSAAAFGVESWIAFAEALKTVHGPFAHQVMEGTATFSQTAAKLGASDPVRMAAQGAGVALCGLATWFSAKRLERGDAIAMTLLFSLAAAPSAWIYDWPLIIAALAFLAVRRGWPLPVQACAAIVWLVPLAPAVSDGQTASLAPALSLYATAGITLFWLIRQKHQSAA